jgi:hypothetical protein
VGPGELPRLVGLPDLRSDDPGLLGPHTGPELRHGGPEFRRLPRGRGQAHPEADLAAIGSTPTTSGTNVYVVGAIPSLGSWNTSDAIPLSSASYPTWSKPVIVPKSTSFEYKYVKKDGSGNVTWESGTNRSYTTGSSSGYTTSDTWK